MQDDNSRIHTDWQRYPTPVEALSIGVARVGYCLPQSQVFPHSDYPDAILLLIPSTATIPSRALQPLLKSQNLGRDIFSLRHLDPKQPSSRNSR